MRRRRPPQLAALGLALALVLVVASGCGGDGGAATTPARAPADCGAPPVPERLVPEVVRELPHDPGAFTQGLDLVDGVLYEGTGLEGRSTVRAVDPATGRVLSQEDLPADVFGEGLTWVDGRLVQLSWTEGVAFVWRPAPDPEDGFAEVGRFRYDGEGWGLTRVGDGVLAMTDGSDRVTERDPDDFSVLRSWPVARAGGAADLLNELEWDGELLWANRWQTDELVGIDRRCRRVAAVVDAGGLVERARQVAGEAGVEPDVLNGIAHVPGTDRYLLTGKLWPVLFEVRFVPA